MIVSALLNGLWQGAPLVAIAYLLSCVVSKNDAATRYALWFATLIGLAVVPVIATAANTGALLLEAFKWRSNEIAYSFSLIPTGAFVHHAGAWFDRSAAWILWAWLAGAAINLVRLGYSFIVIGRIRRNAQPLAGAEADVVVSADVSVPAVIGVLSPRIVIPRALLGALSPMDLQRIVRHERAHVRRHDSLANLIQQLIEACLFFNPWVRLVAAHLRMEREAACDDRVIEAMGNPQAYAACLAAVARAAHLRKRLLLTPGAFGSRRSLVTRIERLSTNARRRLTVNKLAIGGTIVLFIATTLALQAFARALPLSTAPGFGVPSTASAVAAACGRPDAEASVITPAAPQLPHGLKFQGTADVAVSIAPNGHVLQARVLHSSGNAAIDKAVLDAARESTYAPKRTNCNHVQGTYVFHADFEPSP